MLPVCRRNLSPFSFHRAGLLEAVHVFSLPLLVPMRRHPPFGIRGLDQLFAVRWKPSFAGRVLISAQGSFIYRF